LQPDVEGWDRILAVPVAQTNDTLVDPPPEDPRVVVVVESGIQRVVVVVVVVTGAVGTVTESPASPLITNVPGREPAAREIVTDPNRRVPPACTKPSKELFRSLKKVLARRAVMTRPFFFFFFFE
jgi:hypothetical protein